MEAKFIKIQEQISFLQKDILQLSDELFDQQKDIINLNDQIINLKKKIQEINNDTGIQNLNEEEKPPHY